MKDVGDKKDHKEDCWRKEDKNEKVDKNEHQTYSQLESGTIESHNSIVTCEEEYVRRPMNAFMVWSRTERRRLALKFPNMLNCEISKLLGQEWSKMSDIDKKPFILESKKLRTIHSQRYPEYSYRPRRKKRKQESSNQTSRSLPNTTNNSQFGIAGTEYYDSNYNNTQFSAYGYFYDQCASNPQFGTNIEGQNFNQSNANALQQSQYGRIDHKLQNYLQAYPPVNGNGYTANYTDSFKFVNQFHFQDPTGFPCGTYIASNLPYINTNLQDTYERAPTVTNLNSINTLFPELVNNGNGEISNDSNTQSNNFENQSHKNLIPTTQSIQSKSANFPTS